jgi:hypothetical protein
MQTITGISMRCNILPGFNAESFRSGHPVIADSTDPPDVPPPLEVLTMLTKDWMGWRLAYRSDEPEKGNHEQKQMVLKRKRVAMQDRLDRLPEARRSGTTFNLAKMKSQQLVHSARHKSERDVFKSAREGMKLPAEVAVAVPPVVLGVPDEAVLDLFSDF